VQTVDLDVDQGKKVLHFATSGFDVDAVVVRGGPDVKVYRYAGDADFEDDLPLPNETPSGGTVPHPFKLQFVAFCYGEAEDPGPDPDPEPEGESCGLGFWKNQEAPWLETDYSPGDELVGVFTNVPSELAGATLMEALRFGGGPGTVGAAKILLRTAVVALLNADHPDIKFGYTADDVINQVSAALDGNRKDMLDLANQLNAINSQNCPLAGSNLFERPDDGYQAGDACTTDFWKDHESDWQTWVDGGFLTYLPDDKIQDVFDVTPFLDNGQLAVGGDGDTLLAALSFGGGPDDAGAARTLLRAATTSLLNQDYFGQDYGYENDLAETVGQALAQGRPQMLQLAGELDAFNEAECTVVEEEIVTETRAYAETVLRWILRSEEAQTIFLPVLSR
jgi:hypothetical protein